MPRFIVFSRDTDQQQDFNDFVVAADAAEAGFQILNRRNYCDCSIVHSPAALRSLADQCEAADLDSDLD